MKFVFRIYHHLERAITSLRHSLLDASFPHYLLTTFRVVFRNVQYVLILNNVFYLNNLGGLHTP